MSIIATALLGAASGAIGSGISGAFSAKEARKQRQFQRKMSNTAYQRSMRDMRRAGLNPILAYQQGGASTPAGAMGSIPDVGASISRGVSSAVQARQATSLINNTNAQTRLATYKADVMQPAALVGSTAGDALSSAKANAGSVGDILKRLGFGKSTADPKLWPELYDGPGGKLMGGGHIQRHRKGTQR